MNSNSLIRVAIVDDERDGRKVLARLLESFCPEVIIVGEADSVTTAKDLIEREKPDLVFLDIQMPGGSGFDLLRKIEDIRFEIVFVTSFDRYAIEAFKFSAIDYLLKPVEVSDLKEAISRAKKAIETRSIRDSEQLVYLFQNLSSDEQEKRLALQKGDKVRYVKLSEILHIEADSNYCKITIQSGEQFVHSKTLKHFEDLLSEIRRFFRATKSDIINLDFVKEYSKSEPCIVTLTNDSNIEVSRRKKGELLALLKGRVS